MLPPLSCSLTSPSSEGALSDTVRPRWRRRCRKNVHAEGVRLSSRRIPSRRGRVPDVVHLGSVLAYQGQFTLADPTCWPRAVSNALPPGVARACVRRLRRHVECAHDEDVHEGPVHAWRQCVSGSARRSCRRLAGLQPVELHSYALKRSSSEGRIVCVWVMSIQSGARGACAGCVNRGRRRRRVSTATGSWPMSRFFDAMSMAWTAVQLPQSRRANSGSQGSRSHAIDGELILCSCLCRPTALDSPKVRVTSDCAFADGRWCYRGRRRAQSRYANDCGAIGAGAHLQSLGCCEHRSELETCGVRVRW